MDQRASGARSGGRVVRSSRTAAGVFSAAIAVYLLAVVAAALVGSSGEAADRATLASSVSASSEAARTGRASALPPIVGMNINVYHEADMGAYREAVDRIAALGFDTVQVVTPMFQRDGAAASVEVIEGPGRGPARAELAGLMRYAKSRGLRVSLMPQVNFTDPRGNEWRGKISPPRWGPWWRSYGAALLSFADLAASVDADLFVVGCELLTTQKPEHLGEWASLIARVRERFGGVVTYSTTWDTYQKVPFWGHLDAIGISGYWDLTADAADRKRPTDEELHRRWLAIRERVLAFAEEQGRPVLITELGYPSLPWGLQRPWNYMHRDATSTPGVQRRGYASFLRAWGGVIRPGSDARVDPRMLGVLFYEWDIHGDGGAHDTGYGVAGKPAYDVLRAWLAGDRSG